MQLTFRVLDAKNVSVNKHQVRHQSVIYYYIELVAVIV